MILKNYHLIILVLLTLAFGQAKALAENGFHFQSDLEFKHDSSILPGELENYSLFKNEDVKLLIGFFEKKAFLNEAKNLADNDIKNKLFERSSNLDVINDQSQRQVTNFKVTRTDQLIRIEVEYSLIKTDNPWMEVDVYVLSQNASSFAALQYPTNVNQADQTELKKGMHNFTLQDQKITQGKSLFNGITLESIASLTAKKFSKIMNIGNFLISDTFAAGVENGNNSCDTKKYILKGEFTPKKGSALFNFQKLVSDLEDEASKAKPSDKQLTCLSNFYKTAKENAANYWSERGLKEGCIGSDGKVLSKTEKKCSDSTYKEMNASFRYIDKVDSGLNEFMNGHGVARATCVMPKAEVSPEMQALSKLNASVQQTFCCSNGGGDESEKGPLYKVLEMEDSHFAKMSPASQAEMCVLKTKDEHKPFLSAGGLGDCLENMAEGVGKILKDLVAAAASLFDFETIKALGQFVVNLPSSAVKLVKTIGDQIGAQIYSVTDCMSPYEAKQYMCRMVPGIATTLLGPGMIKSFATMLVKNVGKTALAEIVLKAAKENKQFMRLKEIASATARATKKIVKPVMESRIIKPSLATLGKLAKILGTDVSTPLKELVERNAKAAASAITLRANSLATKVLTREIATTVEASAVTATTEATAKVVTEVAPIRLTMEERQLRMTAYREAQASGNVAEVTRLKEELLNGASELTNQERVALVNAFKSGDALTPTQENLVLRSHAVGEAEGRGFGTYTETDIARKARLLKQAGVMEAEERRFFMETGVTGTHGLKLRFGEAERIAGERAVGKAFETQGKTEIIEGMKRSRNYYEELFKLGDKEFAKAFDIEHGGLAGIRMANEFGMSAKESADALKRMLKIHGYDEAKSIQSVLVHLDEDIAEYSQMMAKGYKPQVSFKIYRTKELKAELLQREFEARYPDKYGSFDYDKVPEADMKVYHDLQDEITKIKKEKEKLWPIIEKVPTY